MTKAIRERVMRGEIVDTRKYRYVLKGCQNHENQWAEIRRLPIEYLDTTSAFSKWETVEVVID